DDGIELPAYTGANDLQNETASVTTENVWLYYDVVGSISGNIHNDGYIDVFYKDKVSNEMKWHGSVNGINGTILAVNYGDTNGAGENGKVRLLKDNISTDAVEFKLDVNYNSENNRIRCYVNDCLKMKWGLSNGRFDSLGQTTSLPEPDELTVKNLCSYPWPPNNYEWIVEVGSKNEDHRNSYGIIIKNPAEQSLNNRVSLLIPNEQVMANIVIGNKDLIKPEEDNIEEGSSCWDSDGGKVPTKAGAINYTIGANEGKLGDTCMGASRLVEYYCDNNSVKNTMYKCKCVVGKGYCNPKYPLAEVSSCEEYKKCATPGMLEKGYCRDGKQCVATYECKCTTGEKGEVLCPGADGNKPLSDKCVGAGVNMGQGLALGKTKFVMPAWAKTIRESEPKMCSCPENILNPEARAACIKACQGITSAVEKLTASEEVLKALQNAEEKMCKRCPAFMTQEECTKYIKNKYCNDLRSAIDKLSVPDISLELIEPAKMCKVCPVWWTREQCKAYCKAYSDGRDGILTPEENTCDCPTCSATKLDPDCMAKKDACLKDCAAASTASATKPAASARTTKSAVPAKPTASLLSRLFSKKSVASPTGRFWSIFN
ncbi:MAG: hypothetical protein V1906_00525, partial [Candidatus Woesearchaeota archaeon]